MSPNLKFALASTALALLTVVVAPTAPAATVATWNNNGTDWNTAGNWTPSGIPANNIIATFNSATYTAQPSVTTTTAKAYSLDFKGAGSLTFSGSGIITIANSGITMQSAAGAVNFASVGLAISTAQTFLNSTTANLLTLGSVGLGVNTLTLDDGSGGGGITVSGVISGTGGLTLKSTFTGTATLQAANTYSGATTLNKGTLLVNGSLGSSSAVAVNNGATLGGSGTIGGAVTVASGGTLAPGASGTISTLTFGSSLSLAGTTTIRVNRSGSQADTITMSTGTVTLGGVLNIVNLGDDLQGGETFTLVSGAMNNSFSSITPATPGNGLTWDTSGLQAGGDGMLRVVAASNVAPVANNDTYALLKNTSFTTNLPGVLANDTDANHDSLTAVKLTDPTNGTLSFNPDGSFTYTPNTDFSGTDSFTYLAYDGQAYSSTATVTLTVFAGDRAPVASDYSYSLSRNGSFTTNAPGVLANDSDPDNDALIATNFTLPSHGTLTFAADGSFTYTPTNHFAGTDTFTYQAYDGQLFSPVATVTMTVVDQAPVAVNDGFAVTSNSGSTVVSTGVLNNDTDADGDTLTAAVVTGPAHGSLTLNTDGTFTYTPDNTYFGADSFTYQANDGLSNSVTATVVLTNASGGVYTWNGGTDGSWNTTANWSANDVPVAKSVRYDSSSTGHLTQTLDRTWSISGITIADVSAPITIASGNVLTNTDGVDMSTAGADLTILADYYSGGTARIATNRTLTLSNIVGGTLNGASGPGTLRLVGKAVPGQMVDSTGSLTLIVDGGTIVSNPPVRLSAESAGTVRLIVTNNGTVQMTGNGTKVHVGYNTNTASAGTNIFNLESGSLLVAATGNTSPNGVYVSNGSNCVGILNLNGGLMVLTNKYSTNTSLAGETALQIPFNSFGIGVVNLKGGTLIVPSITAANLTTGGSGTLNFNGTVVTANRPNTNWIANIQNAYVQSGGAIFDTGTNAVTIAQNLQAGSPSGGLTKQGSGALTLEGANTYTGATLVHNGTLAVAGSGSIASSVITLDPGTTLDVSAAATTFTLGATQTLSGNGTNVGAFVNHGTVAPGSSGSGTLTFSPAPTLDNGTLEM